MNRIFKVIFNRERGSAMVVNELTTSVQAGKKAAVIIVASGLLSSSVLATELQADMVVLGGEFHEQLTWTNNNNITVKEVENENGLSIHQSATLKATNNISINGAKNGLILQPRSSGTTEIHAGEKIDINAGGWGIHLEKNGALTLTAKELNVSSEAGITNNSDQLLKVNVGDLSIDAQKGAYAISTNTEARSELIAENKISITHRAEKSGYTDGIRIGLRSLGSLNLKATEFEYIGSTQGANLYGVNATGSLGQITLEASKINISATSEDKAGRAVLADGGASLKIGNSSTESVTISAQGKGTASETIGVWVYNPKSEVSIAGKQLTVHAHADGGTAYGVIAQGKSTDQSEEDYPLLNLDAEKTVITATSTLDGRASGIVAMSQGTVKSSGDLSVTADSAILARGNSIVEVNQSGQNTVQLNGDIEFDYDAATSGTSIESKINVNLNNANSYLNGNIIRDTEAPVEKSGVSGMKLALSNGGSWTSTGDSFVNELTLTDGGIVNINLENGQSHDVTVNTLKGENGTVNIEVAKGESLTHGSLILDKDYARPDNKPAETSTTSKVAVNLTGVTADDISAEELKTLSGNVIQKKANTNASLGHSTTVAEGDYNGAMTTETDKDGNVSDAKVATNTLMRDSLDLASASVLSINRILMNDVRKRLGDLRSAEGTDGVWARYDGGKLSGDHGLENDFHTIQFGYDTALGAGYPRIGFAGSYTMGDAQYTRGDADMDAYSLAAYSTWMADNGMFADVIARVAKVDTDMTVDGTKKGSLDNFAASLSGEFGWRFNVTETFYVEPQAELTYTYIDSDSLALSNGSKYEFDAVDSLMGRAGFAAGFKCPQDKGDVYVRVSAVHEFLGDAAVTGGNGTIHEIDGKDTWVEYGIGANFNINKNTYIYADVERTSGATLDEDWRANVGVRYSF